MVDRMIRVDREAFLNLITEAEVAEFESEMSDRLIEDQFNSSTAENFLDTAFDMFPDGPGLDTDDLMDKRHELVSAAMDHLTNIVIKKWATNLGMVNKKDYESKEIADLRVKQVYDHFRSLSAYQFSEWKLGNPTQFNPKSDVGAEFKIKESILNDAIDQLDDKYKDVTRQPQDSEDEAWEQMKAFQRDNFGEFNANDLPQSFRGDY